MWVTLILSLALNNDNNNNSLLISIVLLNIKDNQKRFTILIIEYSRSMPMNTKLAIAMEIFTYYLLYESTKKPMFFNCFLKASSEII